MPHLDSQLLIDIAFWQSWLEAIECDGMTVDDLYLLSREMAPLIEDALAYYLEHRQAPELHEEG